MMMMMMMMTASVAGLTCYSCSSMDAKVACADPFNATGDGVERCTSQSNCITIRMTGGSLGECTPCWSFQTGHRHSDSSQLCDLDGSVAQGLMIKTDIVSK